MLITLLETVFSTKFELIAPLRIPGSPVTPMTIESPMRGLSCCAEVGAATKRTAATTTAHRAEFRNPALHAVITFPPFEAAGVRRPFVFPLLNLRRRAVRP